jgi:hypothetical protein
MTMCVEFPSLFFYSTQIPLLNHKASVQKQKSTEEEVLAKRVLSTNPRSKLCMTKWPNRTCTGSFREFSTPFSANSKTLSVSML